MWAGCRTNGVIGGINVGDPVTQRFVHSVFQRAVALLDRAHFGAQQLHPEHIGFLALDIFSAHIDDAFHTKARAHGSHSNTVLPRTCLGNNALLAHPARQQNLAQAIVDLMRAGVIQFIAFEVNLRAAKVTRQPLGEIKRARSACIVRIERDELSLKFWIGLGFCVGFLDLQNQRHQGLGDIAPTKNAKMAVLVGTSAKRIGRLDESHKSARGVRVKVKSRADLYSPHPLNPSAEKCR